ncbi:MAG: isocitrate/isopropylmalate dehydrogenase family protein [Caldilinea sp.]|nr:isocitrate/isopropylmalate dehydrogenase family protein [Caldilinea sp.]MDW8439929.1 isocitrate/isopropylmalate dehydrogenase family protein [Caldilineaceae bacterium]
MAVRSYRIALIPGDGVGKEVVPATRRVLEALPLQFDFVELEAGWETFTRTGTALPQRTASTIRSCDGAIFGATQSPGHKVEGYTSPILALRKQLDLYANLRPVVSMPVPGSRFGVDMLIVRENTECLYVRQERLEDEGDTAVAQRVITRRASQRIARKAFEQARARAARWKEASVDGRPRVTIVHKANVLNLTDGLFREASLAVAKEFPDVEVEEQIVDSMIYRMIREPERYDVIVAPNLYGDILSDAAAALVGGLGLAPSANVGDAFTLVEPVHGSAPDIAGKGLANPCATILAAAQLLASLGEVALAQRVQRAVYSVLTDGIWTADLGGTATTETMTQAIVEKLKEKEEAEREEANRRGAERAGD